MNSRENFDNPYIVGPPIVKPELFFGRRNLLNFIENNLQQNAKVILLHGQRRIGKTSILLQIPHKIQLEEFIFVRFDLQDKSQLPLSSLLVKLAEEIVNQLNLEIVIPEAIDILGDIQIFSAQFLAKVYQALGTNNLVLLLDEFDVLDEEDSNSVEDNFFRYLKTILRDDKLFIIPVIGRKPNDLPHFIDLFKGSPYIEVGCLDQFSFKQLITNSANGSLSYKDEAIEFLWRQTAGHPYLTQALCYCLFEQAIEENKSNVTRQDLEKNLDNLLEEVFEIATAGLVWFWKGVPIRQQVIFSAVAKAQQNQLDGKDNFIFPETPLKLLKDLGVEQIEQFNPALKRLQEGGFLNDSGKVTVEIVRRWLLKEHSLQQAILELEKVNPEAEKLYELANALSEEGKQRNAIILYEQTLELNPNHFKALFILAEEYLESQEFAKADKLYTRYYKYNKTNSKEGLVKALLGHGKELWNTNKLENLQLAKEQFNRILQIEPDNLQAKEKKLEIEGFEKKKELDQYKRREKKRLPILLGTTIIATSVVTILVALGIGLRINDCPSDQVKIDGVCKPIDDSENSLLSEKFSSGERTLFSDQANNLERNKGIQAFKKGDYKKAEELFDEFLKNNNNDPEIHIYRNNAKARQAGNPFLIAAVVPADKAKNNAEEILKGVADSQTQFHETGGLNGRLLEIVIVDDHNDPEVVKEVAQQITKNSNILGVIGHNSSDATQTALEEYKKANLAIVSPTSTSTYLFSPVFFRTISSNDILGKKLVNYAKDKEGITKIAVFYDPDDTYSNSFKKIFTQGFEDQNVISVISIDMTQPSWNADKQVQALEKDKYDAIALFPKVGLENKAIEIATANSKLEKPMKLLGGDTLYTSKILDEAKDDKGGNAMEGLILSIPSSPAGTYAKEAKEKWGKIDWRAGTSYDATQVFVHALSPQANRESVLEKLKLTSLRSPDTSGELLEFDDNGDRIGEPILVQVKDNKFKCLQCDQED